jgi:hypothetical protein
MSDSDSNVGVLKDREVVFALIVATIALVVLTVLQPVDLDRGSPSSAAPDASSGDASSIASDAGRPSDAADASSETPSVEDARPSGDADGRSPTSDVSSSD